MTQARQGVFSATDLIEAVSRRTRRSLRPQRPPGEFPEGWAVWFAALGARLGTITGATADAMIAIFLQRELATPPRHGVELNRWQAFSTLWRQQWHPPEPEERRIRLLAIAITVVVHVILLVLLLWLAYVRFSAVPASQGDEIVQVEFIGQGTPEEQGGGPPQGATEERAAAAEAVSELETHNPPAPAKAALQPRQPVETATVAPPMPVVNPEAAHVSPANVQPLQVTEKAIPDTAFVLPPPTPRQVEIPQPQLAAPQVQVPTRDVELREPLPPVRVALPAIAITAPQIKVEPAPVELVAAPQQTPRPESVSAPQASAPLVQQRAAPTSPPTPEHPAPATRASTVPKVATGQVPGAVSQTSGGTPATQNGAQATTAASGAGPVSASRPGAWSTPRRGDDWGASTRNQPGGNAGRPGLLNADGSPRLAAGTGEDGGGFPPGSDHWTKDQFDRAGSWLKRPPNDYTPTRFEKVWLPSETLLEEWVRRNIRQVSIPIPGSSRKLHCVVSLLQLGGGCAISNPDLNDQEAIARPPPDIPFKPALQEDQDILRKPVTP